MTMPNKTQIWFDAVVDLLVAHGNTLAFDKRWSWDKEGGHCLLTRPLDFELIRSNFEIPADVTLFDKSNQISTNGEYLDIRQRIPFEFVQFIPPPGNRQLKLPRWRPLELQKGAKHIVFPVAELEAKLKKMGATSVGKNMKLDGYIEPYKSNYLNHTWLFNSENNRVIGVFIQGTHAGVTTFQNGNGENDIAELIAVFKPMAKKLGLKIWNDQYLTDVLID